MHGIAVSVLLCSFVLNKLWSESATKPILSLLRDAYKIWENILWRARWYTRCCSSFNAFRPFTQNAPPNLECLTDKHWNYERDKCDTEKLKIKGA